MKNVLKGLVKTQVKEQVSRILPWVGESVNATLEAEVLTRSSHSSRTFYAVAVDLSEMELKKILIEKMEGNKSIQRSDEQRNLYKALTTCQMEETPLSVYETGADDQPIVQTSQHPEWFSQPRKPPSPDRAWNTALPAAQGDAQSWISDLAKQADARFSFNELLNTPIDFLNFIMHRLNVDTLTPDLLAGLTYELMKGSCSSLTELEYHLEEVYKETTDQLDWVNPEGYPKETMGYYFYFPTENKIVVARYAEFFEKNLITQEVSGRAVDLEEIQDEDTSPYKITSEIPMEVEGRPVALSGRCGNDFLVILPDKQDTH
nr:retrovirus-related Pol polyprotein from transposon TNT 1-94 [Tanacetum cinerariifolium]